MERYENDMMYGVSHKKLCSEFKKALNKSVILDFPSQRFVYALLGYNEDTGKVLGTTFKSTKANANDREYQKAL